MFSDVNEIETMNLTRFN